MNPFDIVNDINFTKKHLITADNEKEYNAFMVNRALSYFPETLIHAQEMNLNGHLDNLLQYDYLYHEVRKGKRFSKWTKEIKIKEIELVAEYYNISYNKAKDVFPILTKDQVKYIVNMLTKGKE